MFRKSAPQTGDLNELIPDVVRRLLLPQEEVEARYVLKGAEVYAMSSRLILVRGGDTTTIEYERIATTRDTSKMNTWLILAGVALFALGGTSPIFPVAGASLILLGVLARSRRLELFVTGFKESVVLEGAREVLGPLTQRLAEKRAKPSS
jgi:hypothetical protein